MEDRVLLELVVVIAQPLNDFETTNACLHLSQRAPHRDELHMKAGRT